MSTEPDENHVAGTDEMLAAIVVLRSKLAEQFPEFIELSDPDVVADVASRRGDQVRLVSYLHQMSTMHVENFKLGTHAKTMYLVDAFISLAEARNSLGLYSIARTMFELTAFLHEVHVRLAAKALHVTDDYWAPLAESFLTTIIRIRYATREPRFHALLLAHGVPKKTLDPINVMACIKGLASETEYLDGHERYAHLCDFVHHNLASWTTTNAGTGVADVARSSGGGAIFATSGKQTISRYEYPLPVQAERALRDLGSGFLLDVESSVKWLNLTPNSPFSPKFLTRITGNPLGGITVLDPRKRR